jgi:uncharacterized membrane protein
MKSSPNGAERILAMAERQSAHREALETAVIKGNIAAQTRGSYFAFVLGIVTIVGGMLLIYSGRSISGLAAIISAMTGLGGVFVYTKIEQKRERIAKLGVLQSRKR